MPAKENFRANLQAVLNREGISQYELCKITGITRAYINKVLMGTVEPSLTYCEKFATSLKTPLPIMMLDPKVFQRLLEETIDKSTVRDGSLLARELLPAKPKPPGLKKQSPKKTAAEIPENIRLRNWVRQFAG